MARLETQINQIYYLPATATQVSLILTDEVLDNSTHLFVIADLVKIIKKTESSELQKISEIIINIFKENKKLSGEALFETSLAQINQQLADFAHEGKKSWLGKFSAQLVLKHTDNIYLANTGQMSAMLYRAGEFLEVLNPEKRGLHPLKTFSNFTAGKLKSADVLLLTSSNLLNYVALQNLTNMMSDGDVEGVTEAVSKILKDTGSNNEGFASFFVSLNKPLATAAAAVTAPIKEEPKIIETKIEEEPMPVMAPIAEEEIYAPMPETVATAKKAPSIPGVSVLSKIPKVSLPKLPKISIPFPKFAFWEHLSNWAKFFLVSFIIFILLFASNIIAYTIRKHKKQSVDTTQNLINEVVADINGAESALIYRNQSDAVNLLAEATTDLESLKSVNEAAYNQYKPQVVDLTNRINHITVVSDPKVLVTFKHTANHLARAGSGFYVADSATGTVSTYNTSSSDKAGKDLFLLNKIGEIQGLVFIPNTGGVVITNSEMYAVDTTQTQFTLLHIYPKTELNRLRLVNPDRLYTIDDAAGQALRIQFSKDAQINPVSLLKAKVDTANVVDIGTDADVYLLTTTGLNKYTQGNLNTSFSLAQPSDKITSANRLFVANNIYVLESAKKRLLVYNKQGALVTQMFFPNSIDMRDLYVDEAGRNIFILDSNKILSITF